MKKKIILLLDKKDFDELHDGMGLTLKTDDEKFTLERIFEGSSKQDWYRKVMRKGLATLILEFEKLKKKYEDEDKDSN